MSKIVKVLGFVAVAASLTACGETLTERGATGALTGAAVATILGEDITHGALLGAVGGTVGVCAAQPGTRGC